MCKLVKSGWIKPGKVKFKLAVTTVVPTTQPLPVAWPEGDRLGQLKLTGVRQSDLTTGLKVLVSSREARASLSDAAHLRAA